MLALLFNAAFTVLLPATGLAPMARSAAVGECCGCVDCCATGNCFPGCCPCDCAVQGRGVKSVGQVVPTCCQARARTPVTAAAKVGECCGCVDCCATGNCFPGCCPCDCAGEGCCSRFKARTTPATGCPGCTKEYPVSASGKPGSLRRAACSCGCACCEAGNCFPGCCPCGCCPSDK